MTGRAAPLARMPLAALRALLAPSRSRKRLAGRRSARTAVLTGVAAVILAHVGLAVAVETRRAEWRDPEFFHRQKRLTKLVAWEKEQGHTRPLVVVVGGSRPQMGLSPDHLDLGTGPTDPLVFSCAQSGCLPAGERLNVARLFAAGVTPDFLLIEVLPPVLADPGPVDDRVAAVRLSAADLAVLRPYQENPEKVRKAWAKARLASWSTLRVPLVANWRLADYVPPGPNRSDFLWAGMRFHGWSPFHPTVWTDGERAAQLAVARGSYDWLLADFTIQPVNDRLYRDLLAECRDRGVRAALFTMPESPAFRAMYRPGVRDRVTAYLGDLSREFGVPVFDAAEWVADETAFMDGHHLLGPAAEAFSKRLGRECVGPWVRGAKP